MTTNVTADLNASGKEVDITQYQAMVASLLYLTASRDDIMFVVYLWVPYQLNPKESHLSSVKKNLKYIKGTQNLSLWYGWQSTIDLLGFIDGDFV
jgi:hypothetical protein